MSIELKTVMGQMNMVRGRWASDAPNALAVREPTSRLRDGVRKGDLFIICELRGDLEDAQRDDLNRAVTETIRNTYYHASGSITASLRRAVVAANEQLLAEYARSRSNGHGEESGHLAQEDGVVGGVAAMAVRDEDVFIASVGPAVTYVVTRGEAIRFPEASPWLSMADPTATAAPALGGQGSLDVQLFHMQVEPGDILVLGDSRFAAQTSPAQIEKGVAYQGVEGALANLGKLTGGHDCTALVVEIQASQKELRGEEPRIEAPHRPQPRQEAAPFATLPGPRGALARAPSSPRDKVAEPGRAAGAGRTSPRDTRSIADAVAPISVPQAGGTAAAALDGLGRTALSNAGGWLKAVGKGIFALFMVIGTGLRTLVSRVLPGQEREAYTRRPTSSDQARPMRSSPLPQRVLRTVALAVPVVVLAAVGLTYWQQGVARENEFKGLVEQAQASYQQALSADEVTARQLLSQSETLLVQAEAIKTDEPAIGELRTSIAGHRDEIDRVERLYWVGELRTYNDPGSELRRVLVNGLYVYVLDAGADHVYRYQLDEANDALEPDESDPALVRRAQQVETSVVGELVDLVWMPAGGNRQTSDLLILESGGLLEYNPSWGLKAVPIADKDSWAVPVAVGSYFGNFYVLDPQAGQLLRYVPTTEGYSNPAESYFAPDVGVDLAGAVDMAIDGFVYILYADGTIRKFEGGSPVEFKITELDKPLSRPMAIYTAPDDVAQYIYVADAGNGRVVQLNKDGRFIRQFKPRDEQAVDFNTLRSIFVDELTGKLYLVNDHALYIANMTPAE